MKSFLFLLSLGCSALAVAGETVVPVAAQQDVNITIYNENRALVKDSRQVSLKQGVNEFAFQGVSAQMMPQTALLKGQGVTTREQNFNFDLLTHEALLNKSVGQKVTTEYIDPATGKVTRETAELLSFNNGRPVLKIKGQIETDYPGRIIFDAVPATLRAQPTLSVTAVSDEDVRETVELDYLTTGLSWKADYVARLSADDSKMALNGFVTLTNNSGADYKQALLQLVAGDVNIVADYDGATFRSYNAKPMYLAALGPDLATAEALADFYIYTVPHRTDLLSNQTKQVALLSASNIGVSKTYEFNRPFNVSDVERKNIQPKIYVSFENTQENQLGVPLPKGIIRLYKEDTKGNMQFVGEDRISHTPNQGDVRLTLGTAFNLTADMKRVAYKKLSDKLQQGTYEVVFKNGADVAATVQLVLGFPDGFKLLDQSQKGEFVTSNDVRWKIDVPAEGETKLTYKVQY